MKGKGSERCRFSFGKMRHCFIGTASLHSHHKVDDASTLVCAESPLSGWHCGLLGKVRDKEHSRCTVWQVQYHRRAGSRLSVSL